MLHALLENPLGDSARLYKDAVELVALAKTVAEISFGCDDATRQRTLDDLVREISEFEAEYASTSGSKMSMNKSRSARRSEIIATVVGDNYNVRAEVRELRKIRSVPIPNRQPLN